MDADWQRFLIDQIKTLPYVRDAQMKTVPERPGERLLALRTRHGTRIFAVENHRSNLGQYAVNALIARRPKTPVILMARYVSRAMGERLAGAGISFVDEAGNIHLRIDDHYHTLLLGKPDQRKAPEQKRMGAAMVQILFASLVDSSTLTRPVRDLAAMAGVGKTAAAQARRQLLAEGMLRAKGKRGIEVVDLKRLEAQFLEGYSRVLRPHLFLGRFRSQERDPAQWVDHFAKVASDQQLLWALTGAAGAHELNGYYRGAATTLFLSSDPKTLAGPLALLPDRQGPVTILRFFSPLVSRLEKTRYPLARPWLLYAEMLQTSEPRVLEAAREFDQGFVHASALG